MVINTVRKIILTLILVAVATAQEPLRIVTFNLLGMKPGTNWEGRLQCTIDQLVELQPDIIALQEVSESINSGGRDNTADAISRALSADRGDEYKVSFARTHKSWVGTAWEGVAIISRFPVKERGWQSLEIGVFPRKILWNAIETPLGTVNVLNTHLAFREDHNEIREVQVLQILEFVADKIGDVPAWATVLTGDFNATPESRPLTMLTGGDEPFFMDAYRSVNDPENGGTVPAEAPEQRIDYILLDAGSTVEIKESRLVMTKLCSTSGFASDHLGVMAVIGPASK